MASDPTVYQPVSQSQPGVFVIDDDDEHIEDVVADGPSSVQPLEVETAQDHDEEYITAVPLLEWYDPWLPSIAVSILLSMPILITLMTMLWSLTGRAWVVVIMAVHLVLVLLSIQRQVSLHTSLITSPSITYRIWTSAASLFDISLLGFIYPLVLGKLLSMLLTDVDGTPVIEWSRQHMACQVLILVGRVAAGCRLVLGSLSVTSRVARGCLGRRSWRGVGRVHPMFRHKVGTVLYYPVWLVLVAALGLLLWCSWSLGVHWLVWAPPLVEDAGCDPMDPTECWLPFPSCHHLRRDASTATGWRVNLQGRHLPLLKGRIPMDPHFLNDLDGFSTMGPIMFYLDGLKEAHEAGVGQLQGPPNIAKSITADSATLFLDVNASQLVAHSAEIDYLDPVNPVVLLFPAQPLRHNNHYAVAVFNATNGNGTLLARTPGLVSLLAMNREDEERETRYAEEVLPALQKAAPWFNVDTKGHLQLLFDFVTASEESQLGPVRRVRDATLSVLDGAEWAGWQNHARAVRVDDGDCSAPGEIVARTIHGELDVPWFLTDFGPGHRGAFLDRDAVETGRPKVIGRAKFILHIPCSVRAEAFDGKPVRAIMEYGHGLFYSRSEASIPFLLQLAHDEGYLIMAMDWRGMSAYDLLILGKTLLSKPRLFQAVRDNLIQGFANKYTLQHFAQNGMLDMDWFLFLDASGEMKRMWTLDNPANVFYGISQGGILGAGYAALSGPLGLIDRAILGVPGTPFALIMTRSLDFSAYDALLLLNFYDNRHVRVLLALVQMAWDSVEGSGVLATPVNEQFPPMLLQSGLGDAVVPTIAAEALARGLGASVLPGNPRHEIFGIPTAAAVDENQKGPKVTLTELLYEKELASLPVDDLYPDRNSVHECVRLDKVLIGQVAEFVNTGRVIDVCLDDGCRRAHSCW